MLVGLVLVGLAFILVFGSFRLALLAIGLFLLAFLSLFLVEGPTHKVTNALIAGGFVALGGLTLRAASEAPGTIWRARRGPPRRRRRARAGPGVERAARPRRAA